MGVFKNGFLEDKILLGTCHVMTIHIKPWNYYMVVLYTAYERSHDPQFSYIVVLNYIYEVGWIIVGDKCILWDLKYWIL